jgi:hypothetical protein
LFEFAKGFLLEEVEDAVTRSVAAGTASAYYPPCVTRTKEAESYEQASQINGIEKRVNTAEPPSCGTKLFLSGIQDYSCATKYSNAQTLDFLETVNLVRDMLRTDRRKGPAFEDECCQGGGTSVNDLVRQDIDKFGWPVRGVSGVCKNGSYEWFELGAFIQAPHGLDEFGTNPRSCECPCCPKTINAVESYNST